MKKTILLILISFTFYHGNSQITKDNWLVGGNGSFLFNNTNTGTNDAKTTTINIAPDIGYFFIDKFAGGLRLSFYNNHIKFIGTTNNNFTTFSNYNIGPFVRYYFLPVDNPYNILTEISYQFGNEKIETTNSTGNTSTNIISFSAGPVNYFNSSVGIEFLLNYSSTGTTGNKGRANSIGLSIGLQIHLEKDE
ncbi:MAG: hypothetical protein ACTHKC_06475 [Candidatus Nitrosocosmicus sp.]